MGKLFVVFAMLFFFSGCVTVEGFMKGLSPFFSFGKDETVSENMGDPERGEADRGLSEVKRIEPANQSTYIISAILFTLMLTMLLLTLQLRRLSIAPIEMSPDEISQLKFMATVLNKITRKW